MILSRKTDGGALLWTPALALALAATSGLAAALRGPGRGLRRLDHALMSGLVIAALVEAWAARQNPFMLAGLVVGGLMTAALLVVAGSRGVDLPRAQDGP